MNNPSIDEIKRAVYKDFFSTLTYPKKDIIDELITEHPFEYPAGWKDAFFKAMQFNFAYQFDNCEFYRKLCIRKGFDKTKLANFEDIWNIPFILSDIFKYYDLDTRSDDDLKIEFSSSGTSGRKSKVSVNRITGMRLLFMNYFIYKSLGLVSSGPPVNYLMMSYNPEIDSSISTTNSDIFVSYFAPPKNMFFVLDKDSSNKIVFLKDKTIEQLRRFIEEGAPIRVLGLIHYICEVILAYKLKYGKVCFPAGSYILHGGGWKSFANLYGHGFDLSVFLQENTNIDINNVRDVYGLNEHTIFYLECEKHNMHIPNTVLACARDPHNMQRLPFGAAGLIHLITPVIESYPGLSLLTTDYGSIGESCPCSIGGPYLKILGRAGITKKGTCALTAEQYINIAK